jgi:integrase
MKTSETTETTTETPATRTRPRRQRNAELRSREHLTPSEVAGMVAAARKTGRQGQRDSTLLLVAYRHGLRASELADLRWEQVDFTAATLHVRRVKRGSPATHPVGGGELRALRALRRDTPGAFVFASERGAPLSERSIHHIVARAGVVAAMPFAVHPHMLRHATGYYLAARGTDTRAIQAYLGHRNIQHTVRYTELSPTRFAGLWED